MADKQKKWNRTSVSSHSLFHLNWKANVPTRRHAGYRSRSEYICRLAEDDLRKAGVLKDAAARKAKVAQNCSRAEIVQKHISLEIHVR